MLVILWNTKQVYYLVGIPRNFLKNPFISQNALLETCILYHGIHTCYITEYRTNLPCYMLHHEILHQLLHTEYTMFIKYTNTNTVNTQGEAVVSFVMDSYQTSHDEYAVESI